MLEIRNKLIGALRELAETQDVASITYAALGARTGLPWQAVRRILGGRKHFQSLLDSPNLPDAPLVQAPNTRDKILASAGHVFAQKGYVAASLDNVAADAGLTKGAVYWHFSSKRELFFALLDQKCAKHEARLPALIADSMQQASHPLSGIQTLVVRLLAEYHGDPELEALVMEFFSQTRDPSVRERLGARYRDTYARIAGLIEAGSPAMSKPEAELRAMFWGAFIDGLLMAQRANPSLIDWHEVVPKMIEIIWNGLEKAQSKA